MDSRVREVLERAGVRSISSDEELAALVAEVGGAPTPSLASAREGDGFSADDGGSLGSVFQEDQSASVGA
jgi:hypothetical protein